MIGHGWVHRNPGDPVSRCGGPGMCDECSHEEAFVEQADRDRRPIGCGCPKHAIPAGMPLYSYKEPPPIAAGGWKPGVPPAGERA